LIALATVVAIGPQVGWAAGTAVVTGAVQVTDNPLPVRDHSSPVLARRPKGGELDGTVPAKTKSDGVPGAVLFGAALLLGMGAATVPAAGFARRTAKTNR